jgi:hypothetical protein
MGVIEASGQRLKNGRMCDHQQQGSWARSLLKRRQVNSELRIMAFGMSR